MKTVCEHLLIQSLKDDEVCPVIGPATTVLPPDHPSTAGAKEVSQSLAGYQNTPEIMLTTLQGDVCPVTKATVGHHKNKVHEHPSVQSAQEGAVCPVAGVKV